MSKNTNYYLLAAAAIGAIFGIRKFASSSAPAALPADSPASLPAGSPASLPAGSPAAQPESDAPATSTPALNNASISPLVRSSAVPGAPLDLKGQRVLLIGSSSALMIDKELKAALLKEGVADFKNVGVTGLENGATTFTKRVRNLRPSSRATSLHWLLLSSAQTTKALDKKNITGLLMMSPRPTPRVSRGSRKSCRAFAASS